MTDRRAVMRDNIRDGLKLSLRGLLLVAAGGLLWHLPVETALVSIPLKSAAVLAFLLALLIFCVAAVAWRNAAWAAFSKSADWRGAHPGVILLAVPFLLVLGIASLLVFRLAAQAFA